MSRSSVRLSGVSYGAIGASEAPDLMSYPPRGYTPAESRTRIGHGDQRFQAAVEQAMTWQIQQRSGIRVRVDDVPPRDETAYVPVVFDATGAPVPPRESRESTELRYSADGVAMLSAGTTATFTLRFLGIPFNAPARVVHLIDEPRRRGFVVGTLRGHPLSGEESFVIEQTDDGAVWITVRMFWRPASARWVLVRPVLALLQRRYTARYLRALQAAADAAVAQVGTDIVATDVAAASTPDPESFTAAPDHGPRTSIGGRDVGEAVEPLVLPERDDAARGVELSQHDTPVEPSLDDVIVQPDDVAAEVVTSFEVPVVTVEPAPASAPDPGDHHFDELPTPMPAVPQPLDAQSLDTPHLEAESLDTEAIDTAPVRVEREPLSELQPEPARAEDAQPPAAAADLAPEPTPEPESEPVGIVAPVAEPAPESEHEPAAEPEPEAVAPGDALDAPAPPPSAPFVERLQTSPLNLLGRPRDRPLLDGLPSLRRPRGDQRLPPEPPPVAPSPTDAAEERETGSASDR